MRRTVLGLIALLAAVPAAAQIVPTQPYLMAFHACVGTACTDPRNHVVYLAESADGARWTGVPGWGPFAGSVPDVIQRGRTLYIYTANSMVARFDLDTGAAERVPARVMGLPSGRSSDWVDPSLVVDDQGRLVLFLMYAPLGSGDPARCATGLTTCTKVFYSATEVPGSNGQEFVVDPGERATASIPATGAGSAASDPDVFFDGTQYVMYISHGSSTSVWTSADLRGTYTRSTRLTQGLLSNNRGGVPAGHFDAATARYWTYVHSSQTGGTVIRRAVHATLTEAPAETAWTTVMTGAGMGLTATTSVESPSFTTLTPAPAPETSNPVPYGCPPPAAPAPLLHTVVGDAIVLDWGGSAGASSYVVEVGGEPGMSQASVAAEETSATIRPAPGATYYVRVRARGACGTSDPSPDVIATLP